MSLTKLCRVSIGPVRLGTRAGGYSTPSDRRSEHKAIERQRRHLGGHQDRYYRATSYPALEPQQLLKDDYEAHVPAQEASDLPARNALRGLVDVYDSYVGSRRLLKPQLKSNGKLQPKVPTAITATQTLQSSRAFRKVRGKFVPGATDELTSAAVHRLETLLRDRTASGQEIFAVYVALPKPRLAHISHGSFMRLRHVLRQVQHKDEGSKTRYYSLLDDMVEAHISLDKADWDTAISFAGRWSTSVDDDNVNGAMHLWTRMEGESGNLACSLTFNILFDIAVKAGNFALADILQQEMDKRSLQRTRYFHTSNIFYHGLRRDGTGVRRAYQEMVDDGNFIDTTVLNCVVVSLIRAGEAAAGEQVFERMKLMSLQSQYETNLPSAWADRRRFAYLLQDATKKLRDCPSAHDSLQSVMPVAPDLHTYRALIRHHASETGNVDRIADLLSEMQQRRLEWHGSLFYHIFAGFERYGGVRFSSWTKNRLQDMWQLFLSHLPASNRARSPDDNFYLDVSIVAVVLKAFAKCADSTTVASVQQDISARWDFSAADLALIDAVVAEIGADKGGSVFD